MKHLSAFLVIAGLVAPAGAADEPVVKVTGTFEPAEAKPGQTVTLKLKVEFDEKWHTYPTVQPLPANKEMKTTIILPENGPFIFIDKPVDPPKPVVWNEPDGSIVGLRQYDGGGTWEQKVVVSPKAKPGDLPAAVKFRMTLCDKKGCFPKTAEVKATLKVAGDPVEVEAQYAEKVKEALAGLKKK